MCHCVLCRRGGGYLVYYLQTCAGRLRPSHGLGLHMRAETPELVPKI